MFIKKLNKFRVLRSVNTDTFKHSDKFRYYVQRQHKFLNFFYWKTLNYSYIDWISIERMKKLYDESIQSKVKIKDKVIAEMP